MRLLLLACIFFSLFLSCIAAGLQKKLFIILLQDTSLSTALANTQMFKWTSRGQTLLNYNAVASPSQPNYFALISGSTYSWNSDIEIPAPGYFVEPTLVDLLSAAGISWKAYIEDYPGGSTCVTTNQINQYTRAHNPFLAFSTFSNLSPNCTQLVNASQFMSDVNSNTLPQLALYIPNLTNGKGSVGLTATAALLDSVYSTQAFIGRMSVVVSDESDAPASSPSLMALLIDQHVPDLAQTIDTTTYNHYSLLRSVEINFGLPSLRPSDANAVPITFFVTGAAIPGLTPVTTSASSSGSLTGHIAGDLALIAFFVTWFLMWICNRDRSTWRLGVSPACVGGETKSCLTYPVEMWEKRNCCDCTVRHFRTIRAHLISMGLHKEAAAAASQQRVDDQTADLQTGDNYDGDEEQQPTEEDHNPYDNEDGQQDYVESASNNPTQFDNEEDSKDGHL